MNQKPTEQKKKRTSFLWNYLIVAVLMIVAATLFALLYSGQGAFVLMDAAPTVEELSLAQLI